MKLCFLIQRIYCYTLLIQVIQDEAITYTSKKEKTHSYISVFCMSPHSDQYLCFNIYEP